MRLGGLVCAVTFATALAGGGSALEIPDAVEGALRHIAHAQGVASVACEAGERVVFSCELQENGQVMSLCLAEAGAARFLLSDRAGAPVFEYPNARGSSTDFRRTHLTFAGDTGGFAYSFVHDETKHIIYSVSGRGFEDHGLLRIETDAKVARVQHCRPGTLVDGDDEGVVSATLRWPEDEMLGRTGLPVHD